MYLSLSDVQHLFPSPISTVVTFGVSWRVRASTGVYLVAAKRGFNIDMVYHPGRIFVRKTPPAHPRIVDAFIFGYDWPSMCDVGLSDDHCVSMPFRAVAGSRGWDIAVRDQQYTIFARKTHISPSPPRFHFFMFLPKCLRRPLKFKV